MTTKIICTYMILIRKDYYTYAKFMEVQLRKHIKTHAKSHLFQIVQKIWNYIFQQKFWDCRNRFYFKPAMNSRESIFKTRLVFMDFYHLNINRKLSPFKIKIRSTHRNIEAVPHGIRRSSYIFKTVVDTKDVTGNRIINFRNFNTNTLNKT